MHLFKQPTPLSVGCQESTWSNISSREDSSAQHLGDGGKV